MSASHSNKGKRRKRGRPADKPLAEELEILEPTEEELTPLEDEGSKSPVRVTHTATDEDDLDRKLEISVPEMEKKAVAEAVEGPLRGTVATDGASLRWQRVVVRFGGEAMIGSALKDLVREILAPARPLKVVVRRGYGDEIVLEDQLPTVQVATSSAEGCVQVAVDTAEVLPEDLAFALRPELHKLAAEAEGKAVRFAFSGPIDAAVTGAIAEELAGAVRASVQDADGEHLLFDRELEARVQVTGSDDGTSVTVTPADDESVTCAALQLVLPKAAALLDGRNVRVDFGGRAPRTAEIAKLLESCASSLPARIEIARDDGDADVLWPRLLEVAERGDVLVLGVALDGRGHGALVDAFRRETAGLPLAHRAVEVAWPKGFQLDTGLEGTCLVECLGTRGVKSIVCTFGGAHAEPFLPPPVTVRTSAEGMRIVHLDTDAGKPAELARSIKRRLGEATENLAGHAVRVEIAGAGAMSRTMLRATRDPIEAAGATRLEIDDHGTIDVILPVLLTNDGGGEGGAMKIAADAAGRDDAQVETAMQRELDALGGVSGVAFELAPSPLADHLATTLIAREAGRVVLGGDTPVQVHPTLFAAAERAGETLTLRTSPAGDDTALSAMVARELPPIVDAEGPLAEVDVTVIWPGASDPQMEPLARALETILAAGPRKLLLDTGDIYVEQLFPEIIPEYVTLLGKKDGATPPLAMLGIDRGKGDEHLAKVNEKLAELRGEFAGRRVLLVLRARERDIAIVDDNPLIGAVRETVDPAAAATLVFRGQDPRGRTHFEVVHSTLESLAVGTKVGDPRPKR